MSNDYYKHGSWNVLCDRCGKKRKAEDVRKEWTGLIVCSDTCWEMRHPQDFLRPGKESPPLPFIRSEPDDTFVDGPTCTIRGKSAVPGYAVPGCSIPGYNPTLE